MVSDDLLLLLQPVAITIDPQAIDSGNPRRETKELPKILHINHIVLANPLLRDLKFCKILASL